MRAKLAPGLALPRFGTSADVGKPSGLMRVEGDKLLHEAPEPPNDHSLNSVRVAAAAYVIAEKSPPPSAASASSAACALTLMGRTVRSTGGGGTAAGAAAARAGAP